ncbi:unnamed protein product [Caenorhabditis angaria]|uniref:Major facilitator superfamily (MFS) profile domain-containing protein n=1 Tax=Caenorhabditis angaria TaxID=860376 RepID=A0A9P1IY45_9PELO|nr:unnamed protein product [Caenorhabditis angaria]
MKAAEENVKMVESLEHPFIHIRSRRLHVVIMLMFAFFCLCQMTAPMGMSLSCMLNSTAIAAQTLETNQHNNISFMSEAAQDLLNNSTGTCVALKDGLVMDYGGEFVWSVDWQGYVVVSMFIGGFIFSYPAGFAVDRYSARHLLSFSIAVCTSATLLLPILVYFFDVYGAIIARFFMGIGEAFLVPSLNSIVTRWIPLHEKSLAASLFTAGNQVSGIIGNPLIANICASSLGWQAIFYISGLFGIVWLILWHTTVRNSPQNTKWIKDVELDYLSYHVPMSRKRTIATQKESITPWADMFKSSAFWAIIYSSIMGNMMIAIIFVYIPVYFKDVLGLQVKNNGFYSAMPSLSNLITKIFWGYLMDKLKQKKILTANASVKLSQGLSMFGIAASFYFLRFMDCSTPITSLILFSAVSGFFGLSISGFYTSLLSIAPSHIGTLTSLGTVIGFLGRVGTPLLISFFKTTGTAEEWSNVLLVYVFASASCGLIFVLWGSGDVQPWDHSRKFSSQGQ